MSRTEKIESWGKYHDLYHIVRGGGEAYRFSPINQVKGSSYNPEMFMFFLTFIYGNYYS